MTMIGNGARNGENTSSLGARPKLANAADVNAIVVAINESIAAANALTNTKANKSGDVFTGQIQVPSIVVGSAGALSSTITMVDADEGNRFVHNNSGWIGFLDSSGSWAMRVNDAGQITTKQLGDLATHIENRASSYANAAAGPKINRDGDTMTGNLTIAKGEPVVQLVWPGLRAWYMRILNNGNLDIVDVSGNFQSMVFETNGNVYWPNVPGHGQVFLSNLTAWAIAGNAARNVVDHRVTEMRLTGFGYSSGTDFNTAGSGYVITGYRRAGGQAGDVFGLYFAQLQHFAPARGWQAVYNG